LNGFLYLMQSLLGQMTNTERPREIDDPGIINSKVKFEVFGEEMLVREVKISGNSGRAYMPPAWIGKQVKIIRID
jgi:hypothetical protein